VEEAAIAPAFQFPQVYTPHSSCVAAPAPRLHYACNDLAQRELVTAWHQLPDDVRETIVRIARDASDFSRVGELVTLMFGLPLESGIGTKPIT
jgi:hypothetical protein